MDTQWQLLLTTQDTLGPFIVYNRLDSHWPSLFTKDRTLTNHYCLQQTVDTLIIVAYSRQWTHWPLLLTTDSGYTDHSCLQQTVDTHTDYCCLQQTVDTHWPLLLVVTFLDLVDSGRRSPILLAKEKRTVTSLQARLKLPSKTLSPQLLCSVLLLVAAHKCISLLS